MDYKKPTDPEVKAKLTAAQYEVTQCSATEPPFRNEFWNHHEPGILCGGRMGRAALRLDRQVRLRHRLAELRASAREGQRDRTRRHLARDAPRRGALDARRFAPRPRLSGRP